MTSDRTQPLAPAASLSHLAVNVSDLARARAFYEAVLGFKVFLDKSDDPKLPRIFGRISNAAVELILVKDPAPDAPPRPRQLGLAGMVFRVQDLDGICERLFTSGIVKVQHPKMFEGAKVLYVADPDGSFFELIEFPGDIQTPDEMW
ncbi:MAG: hypothetical protein BGP06_07145 [Rhizobiales bacterium 65-9]|nr:MAG: hypothetical protein BGP06_07145 [Rhizobiales bacterium 65-9]